MNSLIPCEDCLCIPCCKNKSIINCSILYNFLEDKFIDKVSPHLLLENWKNSDIWKQVEKKFMRQDIDRWIVKNLSRTDGAYRIVKNKRSEYYNKPVYFRKRIIENNSF